MKIRKSQLPVVIDVDETLISKPLPSIFEGGKVLLMDYYGKEQCHLPIDRHIDLLKSYKARGYEVTVWSANGVDWALQAVKKLKLEKYIDYVATKPIKYVDDKDANTWMQKVFINE